MIDLINDVFSRAFGGGSCGSTTASNNGPTTQTSSIRVKSPKKGTTNKQLSPRQTVVRFVESRDDDRRFKNSTTSLIDMASTSNDSGERDSIGSREILLQDENPLAIMERGNQQNNIVQRTVDNCSEEITEGGSFESHLSNIQQRFEKIDNARKRGLEQIGKFLPSISISFEQQDNNNNNNHKSPSSEQSNQLENLRRMRYIEYCPQCRAYLRYMYISSPGNLFDTIEGRDPPNTKLQNIMPPYCDKCQAHLLFDNSPTKQQMIENLERWLEMNLDLQTKGKIVFVNVAAPTSPGVMIQYSPRGSKQGLGSFPLHDVDVNPLCTTSSLTEAVGFQNEAVAPERSDYFDQHTAKDLFLSDSKTATVTDDATSHDQNELQLVSTESEEQAILRQYSVVKDIATESITKHLKKHYDLTSDLCDRCQMPMMKMGDSLVYCIVCPVIDESAKRSAKEKRDRIQKLYGQNLSTCQYANINDDLSAQQILNGNAKLTALEEGLGFIYSPKNQDNDLTVSSCMSNDDDGEPSAKEECGSVNILPVSKSQEECGSVNILPVGKSHSSDQLSFPSVHQDLSYQDHISDQYSIGIEYTYSRHQQTMAQEYTKGDYSGSASMPPESNILSQTSTVSETQCPRDLPSSEMIWSQVNNNNSSVQISFDATRNENVIDAEKKDKKTEPLHEEREVQNNRKAVLAPVQTKQAETRIARFSKPEDMRDDDEADLRKNRQQPVKGALPTHHTLTLSECNRQGPDTSNEQQPCVGGSKTVRVFGQTLIRSPRSESRSESCSESENIPPLFPPPKAPEVEQYRDAEPTYEVKEGHLSQSPTYSKEESALFPPTQNTSNIVDKEKSRMAPRHVVDSAVEASTSTLKGSSSSQGVDPSSAQLSLSRTQYVRDTGLTREVNSPRRMDPPGKRLTKPKRSEGDPVDLPDSTPDEAVDTPKRSNIRNNARVEAISTPKRNDFSKPRKRQSKSKATNHAKSKQHHHGTKSTECGSSRGSPFRSVDARERKSKKRCTTSHNQAKSSVVDPSPTATAQNNVLVTIPSWVDKEIVNSPVKTGTCGDSSVDRLIQQIDDIEGEFGSLMASIPSTLETIDSVGDREPHMETKDQRKVRSPIAVVEIKQDSFENKFHNIQSFGDQESRLRQNNNRTRPLQNVSSFDSDASDNSVLTSLAEKIRSVRDQIDQIDDESDYDASIAVADSQEEMLQLLSRLNNAAESLRTFTDFQD